VREALHDPEELPFAPGTSPFHLKGIAYRGHVEYAEEHIPGGAAAVNAAFRNRSLAEFYEQKFLAASWYDALPIIAVAHVCARLTNKTAPEFLRERTQHQARQDIHGVYRMIMKLASAETVALRMPRAFGQYLDFGTVEARLTRPGVLTVEQTGAPLIMAPWLSIVGDEYMRVALELAGAKTVNIRRRPTETHGSAHGLSLARIVAEVEFDAEAAARASAG
jgi:hypothetical protein